jgi:hypothetical protein
VSGVGFVFIGNLLAALALPGTLLAQDPTGDPRSAAGSEAVVVGNAVEVRIGAVLASNSGQEFDPRLVAMHRQFNTLFPYSSYRLVKEAHQQVPWGGKVGFDIPGGRYVLVIPKEYKNDRLSMKVMLIEGSRPIVDTALSLRNHATFLVGGPRQAEGVLILSIGADMLQ